jgi:hypothetical protein
VAGLVSACVTSTSMMGLKSMGSHSHTATAHNKTRWGLVAYRYCLLMIGLLSEWPSCCKTSASASFNARRPQLCRGAVLRRSLLVAYQVWRIGACSRHSVLMVLVCFVALTGAHAVAVCTQPTTTHAVKYRRQRLGLHHIDRATGANTLDGRGGSTSSRHISSGARRPSSTSNRSSSGQPSNWWKLSSDYFKLSSQVGF